MAYIWIPVGIVIGFLLALAVIVALGKAAKRADEQERKEILRGLYRRGSKWPRR